MVVSFTNPIDSIALQQVRNVLIKQRFLVEKLQSWIAPRLRLGFNRHPDVDELDRKIPTVGRSIRRSDAEPYQPPARDAEPSTTTVTELEDPLATMQQVLSRSIC